MTLVPGGRTLLHLLLVATAVAPPLRAQNPCPSASVDDAEAGWAAYVANDMVAARRHFESALARCGNDHYSRTGLAYVDLRAGLEERAEQRWRLVARAEPNNVDALVGLGLVRWRAGDVDGVRGYFERVLELAPGHPTAREYLERVGSSDVDPEDDAADRAWRNGDTVLAMQLYRERLASHPADDTAMLRIALMLAWQHEYRAAFETLDRLMDTYPDHLDGRLARARVRAWSGDLADAQEEVREVLELQPDHPEALEALALFHAWAGEYEQALRGFDDLLSIAGESSGLERQRAQTLAWSSRFELSRDAYDALLQRDPDDVEARLGLARTLGFSQDFEGAVAQYDTLLERMPDDPRALSGKARALGWGDRLVESEKAALRATGVDPTSAEAWGTLGEVYRWQGREAAAKDALETALELEPSRAVARDQLQSVELALAPRARPTVVVEDDSDGNRAVSTSLTASWHPVPRLGLQAVGTHKDLDTEGVVRTARTVTVTGVYQVQPGWRLSLGMGGSRSDGTSTPSALEARASVRTPDRHRLGATLSYARGALYESARLAELGVRRTELLLTGRWRPRLGLRVDGSLGVGEYQGTEGNGRRSASLSASRVVGRGISLGAGLRGFSFEADLDEGYFDPDFYGVAELVGYWLRRAGSWTFLVELAPGIQRVRTDGPTSTSVRGNARVAYGLGPGRDVSLSFGYSSAGLVSFATSAEDYRYSALVIGSNWTF